MYLFKKNELINSIAERLVELKKKVININNTQDTSALVPIDEDNDQNINVKTEMFVG